MAGIADSSDPNRLEVDAIATLHVARLPAYMHIFRVASLHAVGFELGFA